MTKKAKLIIVGSGIVGSMAAYHLTTRFGWKDILVLDKGHPHENDGSTSHAPGGVVGLAHSKVMTQMAQYTSTLVRSLDPYQPDRNTSNPVGGFEVALTEARMQDLRRLHGEATSFGAESEIVTPQQIKEKIPYFNDKAVAGGLFVPSSCIVSGAHVSGALARDAMATDGAKFVGNTEVTDLEVSNGRIIAVHTNNPEMPRIECEQLLLCTNVWGPILTEKYNIPVPLLGYEHQYVITKPLPELAEFDPSNKDHEVVYPTMRELDSAMYYRKHWDKLGVGSYWHKPYPIRARDLGRTAINPYTPEDMVKPWAQATKLYPMLEGVALESAINGIFAFSIDGMPIVGESKIKGVWTAIASWITHSGGVGKSVAELMATGESEWDMRQCSIDRFLPFQTTRTFIDTICNKNYAEIYDIVHPRQPLSEPRNVRLTPFTGRLADMDTRFTPFAGIELPNWVGENSRLLEKYADQIPKRTGWAAQYWSPIIGAEHLAVRETGGMFDLTGLAILEAKGAGALAYIEYLCANRIDKPAGSTIYTTWLTPSGGVKRDLAVARLAEDKFWIFVGDGTRGQDLAWMEKHAPTDGSVTITDLSDNYTGIGLWGPNARRVLEKVTHYDVSDEAFPYFANQWIDIGYAKVLALRVSYAGELGWELHIPFDQGGRIWDMLWEAGREFDIIAAGMGAFDSLRIEKGYRLWGGDVYTEYNAYEAGLGWTVKTKKGNFIGREACIAAKKKGLKKKLVCLTSDTDGAIAFGYEPIFDGDTCIGHVTTANYGYSVGKFIAYAYVPIEHAAVGNNYELDYLGTRFPVTVTAEPVFDPKMERLKA